MLINEPCTALSHHHTKKRTSTSAHSCSCIECWAVFCSCPGQLCFTLHLLLPFPGPGVRACACSTLRCAGARQASSHRPVRAAGAPPPRGAPLPACVSAPNPVPGCHRPQPERFGAPPLASGTAPVRRTAHRRAAAHAWRGAPGCARAQAACAARASAGPGRATAAWAL